MINKRFMVLVAAVLAAIILATVLVLKRAPESEGSLAGELARSELSEQRIMHLATGGEERASSRIQAL